MKNILIASFMAALYLPAFAQSPDTIAEILESVKITTDEFTGVKTYQLKKAPTGFNSFVVEKTNGEAIFILNIHSFNRSFINPRSVYIKTNDDVTEYPLISERERVISGGQWSIYAGVQLPFEEFKKIAYTPNVKIRIQGLNGSIDAEMKETNRKDMARIVEFWRVSHPDYSE